MSTRGLGGASRGSAGPAVGGRWMGGTRGGPGSIRGGMGGGVAGERRGGGGVGERRGVCLGLRFFSSERLRFFVPSMTETKEERALIMAFWQKRGKAHSCIVKYKNDKKIN